MSQRRELIDRLDAHGDRTLVHHGIGAWSFAELRRDALRMRGWLADLGLRPGLRVGVRAETSYAWVVAGVALQSLEVSIMGVPAELSSATPAQLAEHHDLSLVLTDRPASDDPPFVAPLGLAGGRTMRLRAPRAGAVPGEGALVFSSGSTGVPKCIVDRATAFDELIAFVSWLVPAPATDSLLMFLPFSGLHTRAYTEAALFLGMDVCLASAATALDAFAAFRPTICHAPPIFYDTVARRIRAAALPPREAARHVLGGRTRLLFTGMSPIARDTLEYLFAAGIEVFNGYGSMEAGMISCCLPGANRLGSVGRPLRPDALRLAADGEIIVSSASPPILGILDDRGELEPLTATDVATGDLGYLDGDGFLWIAGRKKNVLITASGHKVQPELLERAIEACTLVRKAIVFGDGAAHLTAVISAEHAGAEARAAIRAHVDQLDAEAGSARPRVARLVITEIELTVENGLLTSGLFKPNRAAIERRFLAEASAGPREPAATGDPDTDAMLALWHRLLGAPVGPDTSFFDAGGNSLVLTQLAAAIEQRWGRRVAAQDLLARPTPRGVLELATARAAATPASLLDMAWLERDVEPDLAIVRDTPAGALAGGTRSTILLTGATGFLGAHVLRDLLATTGHQVRCVVRGRDGRDRLFARLRGYGLACDAERIEIAIGELAAPWLGLAEASLRDLVAVVHCGAAVNYLYPYARLRDANVGGTREAARIARAAGVTLHHVSTLGVFQRTVDVPVIDEEVAPAFAGGLAGGYTQTKWAAEHLVRSCAAAGAPCVVHRPGEIFASTQTGAWNPTDFVAQTLATIARLGVAPDLGDTLIGAPVELVSRAIAVAASLPAERVPRHLHLIAGGRVTFAELVAELSRHGPPIEVIGADAWAERIVRDQARGALPFDTVVPVFLDRGWHGQDAWVSLVRATQTLDWLARHGCHPPDRDALLGAAARAAIAMQRDQAVSA